MSIKVLLVDDHQIVRDGIRNLLEKEPDIEVVGQAEDGRQAFQPAQVSDQDRPSAVSGRDLTPWLAQVVRTIIVSAGDACRNVSSRISPLSSSQANRVKHAREANLSRACAAYCLS